MDVYLFSVFGHIVMFGCITMIKLSFDTALERIVSFASLELGLDMRRVGILMIPGA